MSQSKKVLRFERGSGGACPECQRRHIHMDDCAALTRRALQLAPPQPGRMHREGATDTPSVVIDIRIGD
jgi:hypothetical protein